jgi:hypothetical protein
LILEALIAWIPWRLWATAAAAAAAAAAATAAATAPTAATAANSTARRLACPIAVVPTTPNDREAETRLTTPGEVVAVLLRAVCVGNADEVGVVVILCPGQATPMMAAGRSTHDPDRSNQDRHPRIHR